MTIASELTNYETYLGNVWDDLGKAGVAFEGNKNLDNVDKALKSVLDIPVEYGKAYYHSYTKHFSVAKQENCRLDELDSEKLIQYMASEGVTGQSGYLSFSYYNGRGWRIPNRNYSYYTSEQMYQICGVKATNTSTYNVTLELDILIDVDFESPLSVVELTSYDLSRWYTQIIDSRTNNATYLVSSSEVSIAKPAIEKFVLGTEVTQLPDYFMNGCVNLKEIDLSKSEKLTSICNSFCKQCPSLNCNIEIPSSVTTIGYDFLRANSSFNGQITLQEGITTIGNYFLSECSNFNSKVILPEGITTLGDGFLYQCPVFNQDLKLPSTIASIGYYFLCMAYSMVSTVDVGNLPSSVVRTVSVSQIAKSPFVNDSAECESTKNGINIDGGNMEQWLETFFNIPHYSVPVANVYRKLNRAIPDLEVPVDSLVTWNKEVISLEGEDISVLCGGGDIVIGGQTIPLNSVYGVNITGFNISSIPDYFLLNKYRVVKVYIPDSVTSIGIQFLGQCRLLTTLSGMENVTQIGHGFMDGCHSFNQNIDDILDGLTAIPDYFMNYCTSFNQTVEISEGVESIGQGFLVSCSSFNSNIFIPESVTSIGDRFLAVCDKFDKMIVLPGGLQTLGRGFLEGCTSFNRPISIPENVTSLSSFLGGCNSFNKTIRLANVKSLNGFANNWQQFNQPIDLSNVTSLGDEFFSNCYSFNQNIVLPATLSLSNAGTLFHNFRDMTSTITINCDISDFNPFDASQSFNAYDATSASYTEGIKINGTNAQAVKEAFPDSDSAPYRKLILVNS